MNEELIRQCAREGARDYWMERHKETGSGSAKRLAEFSMEGVSDGEEDVGSAYNAIRLYHARAVAPLVEVLDEDYGELVADSTRDTVRCLLLTRIEKALAPFQQEGSK